MAKKTDQKAQSVVYYILRGAQRVSLAATAILTVVYWAWLISIANSIALAGTAKNGLSGGQEEIAQKIGTTAPDMLSVGVMKWAIITVVLTIALGFLPRVRNHEKPLLFDSLIIVGLLVISVGFSQNILRAFLVSIGL